jgi:hypothetical protein
MRDDSYWTSRENSLELIELSSINKPTLFVLESYICSTDGEGGGKSKNKNRAGETEKKNSRTKKVKKKNSCRDFSIGKIINCVKVAPNFGKSNVF